jgi:hypothetical protein
LDIYSYTICSIDAKVLGLFLPRLVNRKHPVAQAQHIADRMHRQQVVVSRADASGDMSRYFVN